MVILNHSRTHTHMLWILIGGGRPTGGSVVGTVIRGSGVCVVSGSTTTVGMRLGLCHLGLFVLVDSGGQPEAVLWTL